MPKGASPQFQSIFQDLARERPSLPASQMSQLQKSYEDLANTSRVGAEELAEPLRQAFEEQESTLENMALREAELASQQLRAAEQVSPDQRVGAQMQLRSQFKSELTRALSESSASARLQFRESINKALATGASLELARNQAITQAASQMASLAAQVSQARGQFALGEASLKAQTLMDLMKLGEMSSGVGSGVGASASRRSGQEEQGDGLLRVQERHLKSISAHGAETSGHIYDVVIDPKTGKRLSESFRNTWGDPV